MVLFQRHVLTLFATCEPQIGEVSLSTCLQNASLHLGIFGDGDPEAQESATCCRFSTCDRIKHNVVILKLIGVIFIFMIFVMVTSQYPLIHAKVCVWEQGSRSTIIATWELHSTKIALVPHHDSLSNKTREIIKATLSKPMDDMLGAPGKGVRAFGWLGGLPSRHTKCVGWYFPVYALVWVFEE